MRIVFVGCAQRALGRARGKARPSGAATFVRMEPGRKRRVEGSQAEQSREMAETANCTRPGHREGEAAGIPDGRRRRAAAKPCWRRSIVPGPGALGKESRGRGGGGRAAGVLERGARAEITAQAAGDTRSGRRRRAEAKPCSRKSEATGPGALGKKQTRGGGAAEPERRGGRSGEPKLTRRRRGYQMENADEPQR